MYLQGGAPPLRPFSLVLLKDWLVRVGTTTNFQYAFLSIMLLPLRPMFVVSRPVRLSRLDRHSGCTVGAALCSMSAAPANLPCSAPAKSALPSFRPLPAMLWPVANPALPVSCLGHLQAVIPVLILAVYHASAYCARNFGHTHLWRKYGVKAHAWLTSHQVSPHSALHIAATHQQSPTV